MDAAKKANVEKRLMAGLLVLFGIAFVTGPMKTLGWFRPRSAPAVSVDRVVMSKGLGAVMEDFRKRVDDAGIGATAAPPASRAAEASYTAHQLRDPLKSLLPAAPSATDPAELIAARPSEPPLPPPKRSPPQLQIEGLLWGGPSPSAIIGGDVYAVGQAVEGAMIVAIDRGGVTVELDGDRILYPPASLEAREGGSGSSTRPTPPRRYDQRQSAQQRR